jgi:hypothetical protein
MCVSQPESMCVLMSAVLTCRLHIGHTTMVGDCSRVRMWNVECRMKSEKKVDAQCHADTLPRCRGLNPPSPATVVPGRQVKCSVGEELVRSKRGMVISDARESQRILIITWNA